MKTFQSYNSKTKKWVKFETLSSGRTKIVGQRDKKYKGVPTKKGKGRTRSRGKRTGNRKRKTNVKLPFLP